MNYQEACAYLKSLQSAGMQMGLERMVQATNALSHPEQAFRAVHVAGTNGKGSTTAMIAAMLTACGYRVGVFSSPAVTGVCDTVQIDGKGLSEEVFAQAIHEVHRAMPSGLSEYECLTAAAFCAFRTQHVDIAVVECCLGGETDCTNILPPPLCAVFTPISLDHTAILGNSVEKIAKQKSGIIKPPCDIVSACDQHEDALGVLFETAATHGLTVYTPSAPSSAMPFCHRGETAVLAMQGEHQKRNAATACMVLERLHAQGFTIDWKKAINALEHVSLPCRLEQFDNVLLDGAHNAQGIDVLYETIINCFDEPITLVIGMLRDKNITYALSKLAPLCKRIYCCTPAENARAMPGEELAVIANTFHHDVHLADTPQQAYLDAKKTTGASPIVIGGSFYVAGDVRRILV